jgi:hypothetical protein
MKGSRYSIIKLVESSNFLFDINKLITGTNASVSEYDNWLPKSLHLDKEAELKDFLKYNFNPELGDEIKNWWLAEIRPTTRTPNWDLISTCTINNKKGILLVEGKAHYDELNNERIGKRFDSKSSKQNDDKIGRAINVANASINCFITGVSISKDSCYQLSNRIAYAWWLASHGIPTVLLYLGFLNADDMRDGKRKIFETPDDWKNCFLEHANIVGVNRIVDRWVDCGKSKFITIYKPLK